MKKENKKSVFMQMYEGTRTKEGSFNEGLYNLFLKADLSNRAKLVKTFPDFFGNEVPEFGVIADANPTKEPCMRMNAHLRLKDVSQQSLEESLKDSEEMIDDLYSLIYEMLQKHRGDIQRDNNDQSYAFRILRQSRKYGIEISISQSREASTHVSRLLDRC